MTRLVNVADVGTPINPRVVETQLSGGAIMQLGFSLFEKMLFDADGQLRNASLAGVQDPRTSSILPKEIINEAVVAEQGNGPFGGKGVGETATFGVSPAIANAIHDAVGVRLTELPDESGSGFHGAAEEMRRTVQFRLNGEAVEAQVGVARDPGRGVAGIVRPVRRARELRPGPVRLLHGAGERHCRLGLPLPRQFLQRTLKCKLSRRERSPMPCRRRSSSAAPSSAASARPASC